MFSSEYRYSGLVLLDERESKDSVSTTDMVGGICASETGIISDGRTDTRIDVGKQYLATNVQRDMNIAYQKRILLGLQRFVHYLLTALY